MNKLTENALINIKAQREIDYTKKIESKITSIRQKIEQIKELEKEIKKLELDFEEGKEIDEKIGSLTASEMNNAISSLAANYIYQSN